MGLVDLFDPLERGDIRSYLLFETFVFAILEKHLQAQNKSILRANGAADLGLDGIAGEGFDELPGPVGIEIKQRLVTAHGSGQVRRLLAHLAFSVSRAKCNSILLVVGEPLPKELINQTIARFSEVSPSVPLRIVDLRELDRIAGQFPEFSEDVLKDLADRRLRETLRRRESNWRTERQHLIRALRQKYSEGRISLFLGAGVSIDAGMPSWDALIDTMFVTLVRKFNENTEMGDEDADLIAKRLMLIDGPNPLMAARYLRRGFDGRSELESGRFLSRVAEAMYRQQKPSKHASELLDTLAAMCIPWRSGPKVDSVVSYNFDDLLEKTLTKFSIEHRSIYREGDLAGRDELPVYHVHGYLPESRQESDKHEQTALVFSEEGYHELFQDPYHWSNLIQLSQLRDNVCLMVGLSLTDPNLRRLLEIAARKNGADRHFALMRRLDYKRFVGSDSKGELRANAKAVRSFLESHHRLHEELFRELGLRIIWFSDWQEISSILKEVMGHESGAPESSREGPPATS